jgi:hypothetical protein
VNEDFNCPGQDIKPPMPLSGKTFAISLQSENLKISEEYQLYSSRIFLFKLEPKPYLAGTFQEYFGQKCILAIPLFR